MTTPSGNVSLMAQPAQDAAISEDAPKGMDRAAAGPGPAEDSDYRSGTGCAQGPHSTAALSEAGGFRARLVKVAGAVGNWLKISRRSS